MSSSQQVMLGKDMSMPYSAGSQEADQTMRQRPQNLPQAHGVKWAHRVAVLSWLGGSLLHQLLNPLHTPSHQLLQGVSASMYVPRRCICDM